MSKRHSSAQAFRQLFMAKLNKKIAFIMVLAMLVSGSLLSAWPTPDAFATLTNGENATHILGATTSYTTRTNQTSQAGFYRPRYEAYDSVHKRLFVSDDASRVKVYDLSSGITDGMAASWVLGHTTFTAASSNDTNAGAGCTTSINACGMEDQRGLAYDSDHDRLFVADASNNRVLVFDTASITNGEPAAYVLGRPDFTSDWWLTPSQYTSDNKTQMYTPQDVYYDSVDQRLFVSDMGFNRVITFDLSSGISNGMAAEHVLGQKLFTTDYQNMVCGGGSQYGTSQGSQCGLYKPTGLTYDSATHRLFVSDSYNARVMAFDITSGITDGMSASAVLGQPDYSTRTGNTYCGGGGSGGNTPNQCSLKYPMGMEYVSSPHYLFVADGNNRVLIYDVNAITNGEAAVNVIGKTDFITYAAQLTQNGLYISYYDTADVAFDSANNQIFVSDNYNSRVLTFDVSTGPAAPVISSISSGTPSGTSATITWTTDTASSSVVNYGLTAAWGTTSSDGTLDTSHSRTLTGLTQSTTYHYRVCSTDAGAQTTCSTDRTFATTAGDAPSATAFAGQTFGTYATTNFGAVSNMTAVPAMKLAKVNVGAIQWTNAVNANGQDYDSNVAIGTGFVSINKAALDASIDSPAHVKVAVRGCINPQVWYATGAWTNLADIKANGQVCNAGTTPACSNISCASNIISFDVPHFDSYGAEGEAISHGIPVTLGINNQPPAFSSGPSDNNSTGINPTNVGVNVSFTATASDPNSDDYYVAICKTAAITPHEDAAPTCDGGSWGSVSAATTSGSPITPISYMTTGLEACQLSDNESCLWYAYACDGNGTSNNCSVVSNAESPFNVNHRPVIGTVTAGNAYGSNASVDPGSGTAGTVYVRTVVTDPDTDTAADTISMYVCSDATTAFDPATATCTNGTTLCSATGVASGGNAECTFNNGAPIPTHAGNYPFKVYLRDSHNFADAGTSNGQSYNVTNIAPTVGTYVVNDISPVAGGSVTTSFTVLVSDDNGADTITAVDGFIYDTHTATVGGNGECSPSEMDCYMRPACVLGSPSGTNLTATCSGIVTWFNIDPTSPGAWRARANVGDQALYSYGSDSSTEIIVGSLSATAVTQSSIAYGGVAVGGTSGSQPTTLQNVGNIVIDVGIHGTDMSDGNGHSIAKSQQRWATATDFTYLTGDHPLVQDEVVDGAHGASNGCANQSIGVRAIHSATVSDQTIYWKLRIPDPQPTGSYSGSNTFTSVVDGLCTGTD